MSGDYRILAHVGVMLASFAYFLALIKFIDTHIYAGFLKRHTKFCRAYLAKKEIMQGVSVLRDHLFCSRPRLVLISFFIQEQYQDKS